MIAAKQPQDSACPFPGMDPYLESRWSDMHTSMSTYARDALADQLPPNLVARLEEYVVLRRSEAETLRYIKVQESQSGRLITTIEFLIPKNKIGEQADQFQAKQEEMLEAGVNIVEIDLLRRGRWVVSVPEYEVPAAVSHPYRVCVVRAHRAGRAEMYPVRLRQPLPTISIPLRPDDKDVPLNLQTIFTMAYQRGGYANTNYSGEPIPELSPEDTAWADQILKAAGKRGNKDE